MNFACPACGATNRVPDVILFRGGKEVARQAGAMAAGDLVRWVQAHVAK